MHLALYKESSEKQMEGAPVYIGDATFYLRRWGTNESQAFLKDLRRALFGPHHRSQEGDENKVVGEWLAGYGVVGWEDVLDADSGKEFKYSKKNARMLFLDPEYYLSLNAELFMQANRFENYLYDEALDELEELKKK